MLIMLAMDYRQWLLSTTCLVNPIALQKIAFSRSAIKKIKAGQMGERGRALYSLGLGRVLI